MCQGYRLSVALYVNNPPLQLSKEMLIGRIVIHKEGWREGKAAEKEGKNSGSEKKINKS